MIEVRPIPFSGPAGARGTTGAGARKKERLVEKGGRVAALVAPRRRRRRAAALFMDPYAPAITDVRCWWGGVWIDR